MIVQTLLTAVLVTAGGQQASSPAQIISKMLARYAEAKTLTGTVVLTQAMGQQSGQLRSDLQIERPHKLFIRQVKSTNPKDVRIITADGNYMSYNPPQLPWDDPGKRLVESMKPNRSQLTLMDAYSAGTGGLLDRNATLDIVVGRRADLEYLRGTWATLEYAGTTEAESEKVHVIAGSWREYGNAAVTGRFLMWVTDSHDLRRYVVVENLLVGGQMQRVESRWDVDIQVNAKVDDKLFKLVR